MNTLEEDQFEIHIASRSDPGRRPYYSFDRKNQHDVLQVIGSHQFDVIVDFISFSLPDAQKLIQAISHRPGYKPYLITVSSTYVYGNPSELQAGGEYNELSFDPQTYHFSAGDRPEIDYFVGKRSMEAYIVNHYENYALIRFPVILGADDYTGRTNFFIDIIKNNRLISFDREYGVSNFIFSREAVQFMHYLVKDRVKGIFNCCFPEQLDQFDILSLYCQILKKPVDSMLEDRANIVRSPFYYKKDFVINNEKQMQLMKFNTTFAEALKRDLDTIVNRK